MTNRAVINPNNGKFLKFNNKNILVIIVKKNLITKLIGVLKSDLSIISQPL